MRLSTCLQKVPEKSSKQRSVLGAKCNADSQILPRGHALGFVNTLGPLDNLNLSRAVCAHSYIELT
jgi:hypothetical protein